jgi:uncharacterized membrane protein YgcG
MKAKRNIGLGIGILLFSMAMFVSTAAADTVQLGLSISPDNVVVGTNSRWVSVVFHVEDAYVGCPYTAADLLPETITLEIKDNDGVKYIGTAAYDRYEITDAEKDGSDEELVLIYKKTDLLNGLDLTDPNLKFLTFKAAGDLVDGNDFIANYNAKVTQIKGGKGGNSGKGGNGGSGGNGGNGRR